MAWIQSVPPSPRHPYERYQVRYQDGTRQRSAGIFRTRPRALAEQRAIERGRPQELPAPTDLDHEHLQGVNGSDAGGRALGRTVGRGPAPHQPVTTRGMLVSAPRRSGRG